MNTDMLTIHETTAGWREFTSSNIVAHIASATRFEVMLADGRIDSRIFTRDSFMTAHLTEGFPKAFRVYVVSRPNTVEVELDDLKKMNAMLKLGFGEGATTTKLDAIIRNAEV